MPLITYDSLAKSRIKLNSKNVNFSDNNYLKKVTASEQKERGKFDIFLSHSYDDKDTVIDIVNHLKNEYGVYAYVDWLADPFLDRSNVNRSTANLLKTRMQQCDSLAFLDTEKARESNWTPWEVGYMDGLKERVFIIPVVSVEKEDYKGMEYFSLYPFLDEAKEDKSEIMRLWVNSQEKKYHYRDFHNWIKEGEPLLDKTRHHNYPGLSHLR